MLQSLIRAQSGHDWPFADYSFIFAIYSFFDTQPHLVITHIAGHLINRFDALLLRRPAAQLLANGHV
jgi:hypothetical protein